MSRDTSPAKRKPGPPKGAARRGFGRLRQERSGRWSAAYIGPDGQLHRPRSTFHAKDDAVAWLATERRLIDLDVWTAPADRLAVRKATGQTLGDYAPHWLANRRTTRGPLKPRTKADYQRLLDRHLLPAFGAMPLQKVTAAHVVAWYESFNTNTPTERARAYQLLGAIFATAVGERLTSENPCQIPGGGRVSRAHRVNTATLEELAIIVENMPDRLRLAVQFGAWCALRYGEIAELRRSDINLRLGRIEIRRGVTWPHGKPTIGTPKTQAGRRDVYIPPHLADAVRSHLEEHTQPGKSGLLFAATDGGHLHPGTFRRRFDRARKAAGRPDLRFHDLRHTGAVMAAQAGATLSELMGRLGHSTPGAAMLYQHASQERDQQIAARLSAMIEEGK